MATRNTRPDPYEVLGLRRDASSADISRAYRCLARVLPPDSSPADPAAADRFRAVPAVYELLSDPAPRAAHDHRHAAHVPVNQPREVEPDIFPRRAASQLRPLDFADATGWVFAPAGAAVRPGPARIEPSPDSAPQPSEDAAVWLAELLQPIRRQARDGRYWAW